jgi:hypothetical protein
MTGYYGLSFVMSLYLQELRGLSALGTGLVFLPMMLTGGALTPFIARLGERFGPWILVTSRQAGWALAVAVFGPCSAAAQHSCRACATACSSPPRSPWPPPRSACCYGRLKPAQASLK